MTVLQAHRPRVTALAALLLAACAGDMATEPRDGCTRDADCARGQCHDNLCLEPSADEIAPVDVEVRPDAASGLGATPFLAQTFVGGVAEHTVVRPVRHREVVVFDGTGTPVDARVTFTGRTRIPTRESAATLHLSSTTTVGVALIPDVYDLRVVPDRADLAPLVVRGWDVRPGDDVARREFQLPARYRGLQGRVTLRTQHTVPVPGVVLEARGMTTGLVSSTAESDAEGRYALRLPECEDVWFEVRASVPGALRFAYVGRVFLGMLDAERSRRYDVALEDAQPDLIGAVSLAVVGASPDGAVPVRDALVTLTASSAHPSRQLTVTARTADKGLSKLVGDPVGAPIPLLAGTYVVHVRPPANVDHAPLDATLDLSALGPGVILERQLVLAAKRAVVGRVASALGTPLAGATVRLEREDEDGVPTSVVVVTDADGHFAARVAPGYHVIVVGPPGGASIDEPLAPTAFPVEVGPEAADLGTFNLAPARLVRGRARTVDGAPLARAEVEIFARVGARAVTLVHATTDASGEYFVLLPLHGATPRR
jgi:hypothetical protein